jgi:hypothetical protein
VAVVVCVCAGGGREKEKKVGIDIFVCSFRIFPPTPCVTFFPHSVQQKKKKKKKRNLAI